MSYKLKDLASLLGRYYDVLITIDPKDDMRDMIDDLRAIYEESEIVLSNERYKKKYIPLTLKEILRDYNNQKLANVFLR